jgi:hypothetical protein
VAYIEELCWKDELVTMLITSSCSLRYVSQDEVWESRVLETYDQAPACQWSLLVNATFGQSEVASVSSVVAWLGETIWQFH